ncbi:MAG: SulP family inorganic anion transporter [Proteobacteria bacterium]|jgi:SulP family sulfate permease|nr:SulP family inorganic anion transporter [Pseudomonadota bacterium]
MFQLGCQTRVCFKNEILSGLTVALALVPEAVAFAFVAGVEPLVGLYAAFMVGLLTAVFGGRPGMISGATGAMAVVMVALVAQHGVEYLFATVVLTGLIQILTGILRLGKYIRIVPYPVMLGFVNGLAIVIFLAQIRHFKIPGSPDEWMSGIDLMIFGGLVLLTIAIIQLLPRLTAAFPASLAAILVVTLLVIGLDVNTNTVGDLASIKGGFPEFHIPIVPFNLETLQIIFPYAIILAAVGLIESLLTLSLIDDITGTRGRGNRECIGQGIANSVTGFFGGMGGCAMIGQSMINVNSGGHQRLSGISAALFLLMFIMFASSLIESIPMAALVGVMFVVVLGTFEWSSFRIIGKIPKTDAFVLVLVSAITVFTDLAIAVLVGVIVSALFFAWEHASHINVKQYDVEDGSRVYELNGPLFFGSVKNFLDLFTPANDPNDVIIDFKNSRVVDHSAIEAIDNLADKYIRTGKQLHLRHLTLECKDLLTKAGDLVEVNVMEDPIYHVADDKLA